MVNRIAELEIATRDEGLSWRRVDLTGAFADWMDSFDPDERESNTYRFLGARTGWNYLATPILTEG